MSERIKLRHLKVPVTGAGFVRSLVVRRLLDLRASRTTFPSGTLENLMVALTDIRGVYREASTYRDVNATETLKVLKALAEVRAGSHLGDEEI